MNDREKRQVLEGVVRTAGANKTITVVVPTVTIHPKYKKYLRRERLVRAHDETNDAKPGDRVRVRHCRPLSKTKNFRLVEIVERAKTV